MDLFDLVGKLTLDAGKFTQGVKNAESAGNSLSEKMSGLFDKLESAAKVFISGAAINKAVTMIRGLADETAAAGDRIDKQSQVLGISRKAYQEWDYILSQNGASIDNLGIGMKTLNSLILSGVEGSTEAKDSFAELGLSVHDLNTMSQEEQWETVVKAFQRMPAGAQKSALAVKIFGRQGMTLLPLLNSTADSVDNLKQKADDLGLIMGDDAVDASVAYTDSMDTLQRTFKALRIAIGSQFLPIFTKAFDKVAKYTGKLIKAFQKDGLSGVFDLLRSSFGNLIDKLKKSDNPMLQKLGASLEFIQGVGDTIVGLFTDFDGTVAKLQESDQPVLSLIGSALAGIKDTFDLIVKLFEDFDGTVAELEQSDNPVLQALAESLKFLKGTTETLATLFKEGVPAAIKKMQESDSKVLSTIGDSIHDLITDTETAMNRIKETIKWAKELFGVSGENGRIFESYASKIGHSYMTDVTDEASQQKWLRELRQGLYEAGMEDSKIQIVNRHFDRLDPNDPEAAKYAMQSLHQMATDPAGTDALLETWDRMDTYYEEHPITPTVTPIVPEEELKKRHDDAQAYMDANPITQKILLQQWKDSGGTAAPQGYLNGIPGHASGQWDVPYDNYLAYLHRNETVLSASQARDFKNGGHVDLSGLKAEIIAAVRTGLANATVRAYIDGQDVTDRVNRNNNQQLRARRFAT